MTRIGKQTIYNASPDALEIGPSMEPGMVLLAAVPIALAVLLAFLAPRFSRSLLGPAVVVMSLVAAVMITNRTDLGRDAWGPALAVIGIFVGAVGFIAGLILIILGSALAGRNQSERSATPPPYSKENPYRIPTPGLFTPKRLLVFIVGTTAVLSLIGWLYSWMA